MSDSGMPVGKIGDVTISRLVIGGNQFSGWSHSRDLKYLRDLFKAYATEKKILETLRTAEENGINTIITAGSTYLSKYWKDLGGKMQWIAFKVLAAGAIHPREGFKFAFDNGADFICVGMFDFQVRENVIIAKDAVARARDRQRSWRA
jgi:hypothetical protein